MPGLLGAFVGELCGPISVEVRSILLLRLCLALSTFRSLNRSCNKLAPLVEGPLAVPLFWVVRAGRCAEELLLLEVGVILVCAELLEGGRFRPEP